MKLSGFVGITLWSFLCLGQEVHVSPGNGNVVLSVWAQKSYQLVPGEVKTPVLSVECTQKGKKTTLHFLKFSPGGSLAEDNPEGPAKGGQLSFNMTIGGNKQMTTWIPYGDTVTFTYFGKTEPERMKFIQFLLSSATVSIDFKPFLTGAPTTSVFDISKLREEMNKYPECLMK
jgi:hypothetical protein